MQNAAAMPKRHSAVATMRRCWCAVVAVAVAGLTWLTAVIYPFGYSGDLWLVMLDGGCAAVCTLRLTSFDGGVEQSAHARRAMREQRGLTRRIAPEWWTPESVGHHGWRQWGITWPHTRTLLQQTHPYYTVWMDLHEVRLPLWITVAASMAILAWRLSQRRRHAPDGCTKCGYDLQGNTSGRCPECGTHIAAD